MDKKLKKTSLALLLVMSVATLALLVHVAYTLSEPPSEPSLMYVYNAVLYGQTPEEYYEPEQLGMVITEINSTLLYCCAPSPNLHGYFIKYNERFYQIVEPILHVDFGPFGPNDVLKKIVVPTVGVAFGWICTGAIVLRGRHRLEEIH